MPLSLCGAIIFASKFSEQCNTCTAVGGQHWETGDSFEAQAFPQKFSKLA
jgi:hypothetical protein